MTAAPDVSTPVLIVGGGGCGLSTSCFLSDLGVDHLLVEKHASTSRLPKAHYLNQRTLEIYRQHGIAESLYEAGAPLESFSQVRWRTTLGGDGPLDGRDYYVMDTFGGGDLTEVYDRDSACRATRYPQMRLEPLLRRHAEERAPGRVLFSHELVSWEQGADGVGAVVQPRHVDGAPDGDAIGVHAEYLVAADGGRTIGPALGIAMEGPTNMLDMVSVHFTADLSQWWQDGTWASLFISPEGLDSWGSGNAIMHGPTWSRHSEEWVVHFAFGPDDPKRFDEASMVPRLKAILKLPDLELEVHEISHWIVDRIVAERYQEGRIFLAGDAAHRQPPTSGLGLNTAVQDAHNLAWKLGAVVDGRAGPELLESYERERRPIGITNADWALMMFRNHGLIDAGIGIQRGAPKDSNHAAVEAYFAPTPLGESVRARAAIAFGTQAMEFHDHAIEIGFYYQDGAFVPDASEPPPRDPLGQEYHPTTRPGHRLPHAWLARDGERLSTQDLVRPGRFALLTDGARGWSEGVAEVASQLGVPVDVHSIGPSGEWTDVDGRWTQINELSAGGAVLVRPDHHVAWRSPGPSTDPAADLADVLTRVLALDRAVVAVST